VVKSSSLVAVRIGSKSKKLEQHRSSLNACRDGLCSAETNLEHLEILAVRSQFVTDLLAQQ
jgi:hypothetical protein